MIYPDERFAATKNIKVNLLYEIQKTPEEKRESRRWALNHAIKIHRARLFKEGKL